MIHYGAESLFLGDQVALDFARHRAIEHSTHHDERSSAFFALGIAKTTGRPVAIITTSGTAAAELHPAMVEARFGRVPLLALTADRPPELRGTGANQSIDQINLYGTSAKWFQDAPLAAITDQRADQGPPRKSMVSSSMPNSISVQEITESCES